MGRDQQSVRKAARLAPLGDSRQRLATGTGTLPQGSAAPGEILKLAYGDQLDVADIDSARPGPEIYTRNATRRPHENGTTPKRLGTEVGDVDLATRRDRNGTIAPQLVGKAQGRLNGLAWRSSRWTASPDSRV